MNTYQGKVQSAEHDGHSPCSQCGHGAFLPRLVPILRHGSKHGLLGLACVRYLTLIALGPRPQYGIEEAVTAPSTGGFDETPDVGISGRTRAAAVATDGIRRGPGLPAYVALAFFVFFFSLLVALFIRGGRRSHNVKRSSRRRLGVFVLLRESLDLHYHKGNSNELATG